MGELLQLFTEGAQAFCQRTTQLASKLAAANLFCYVLGGIDRFLSLFGATDPLETIFKGILWFLVADLICVALLIAFPQISLFLPNLVN